MKDHARFNLDSKMEVESAGLGEKKNVAVDPIGDCNRIAANREDFLAARSVVIVDLVGVPVLHLQPKEPQIGKREPRAIKASFSRRDMRLPRAAVKHERNAGDQRLELLQAGHLPFPPPGLPL